MINFEIISIMYQLEISSQHDKFNDKQYNELMDIARSISRLTVSIDPRAALKTIQRYKRIESILIYRFVAWGGDEYKLKSRIKEFEDNSIPYVNDAMATIKNIRKKLGV